MEAGAIRSMEFCNLNGQRYAAVIPEIASCRTVERRWWWYPSHWRGPSPPSRRSRCMRAPDPNTVPAASCVRPKSSAGRSPPPRGSRRWNTSLRHVPVGHRNSENHSAIRTARQAQNGSALVIQLNALLRPLKDGFPFRAIPPPQDLVLTSRRRRQLGLGKQSFAGAQRKG